MINYEEYKGFLDPTADREVLISKHNKPLTATLFVERDAMWAIKGQESRAIYTLGEREREGLPSAYKIYMASVDEYEAAMKLVGSLYHWQALCECDWFMEELKQWRAHLALKDFSLAKSVTLKEARGGDGPAARKLLDMANRVINPPASHKKSKPEEPKSNTTSEFDDLYNKYLGQND